VSLSPAKVIEIRSDYRGHPMALLESSSWLAPAPGQYLLTCDDDRMLPFPLFAAGKTSQGVLIAPPIPERWQPGTVLELSGPFGKGYQLSKNVQHLMLVVLGGTIDRILPMGISALNQDTSVTLFADAPLPALPPSIEAYPLSLIAENLQWADFVIADMPIASLADWRERFGMPMDEPLPCPGQALVISPMPCGGLADCGVCAIPFRRTWKMCCKDGPVFDLNNL
jgi:hypothetical protein